MKDNGGKSQHESFSDEEFKDIMAQIDALQNNSDSDGSLRLFKMNSLDYK